MSHDIDIALVRADNPGPMTLDGTNTWIVTSAHSASAVVIDPGPLLESHGTALDAHLAEQERAVELILLTHGHPDHSESAKQFARRHDAPMRAVDPQWSTAAVLRHGERIAAAGVDWEVLATPGHTSDSVTFLAPGAMFTGDTVLGRGTTVVAYPDGQLNDYLESLEMLYQRARDTPLQIFPGHGPSHPDAPRILNDYLAHRHQRLQAVAEVLEKQFPGLQPVGDPTSPQWLAEVVAAVVAEVYADVPEDVKQAAAHSVRAQLHYLLEDRVG